jgi:hypothetical protein
MKHYLIFMIVLIVIIGTLWAWTDDLDKAVPAADSAISGGDDAIRNTRIAVQERENIDHYWPWNGTVVDDPDAGKHRQVTFQAAVSDPTPDTGEGIIWGQTVSTVTELCYDDNEDNTTQITSGGKLFLAGEYDQEVNLSNTGNSFAGDALACTSGGYLTLPFDSTDTTEGNIRYDDTSDTVSVRNGSAAWFKLMAQSTASQFVTGTYNGDGTASQGITGVGFQPEIVLVMPGANSIYPVVKTSDIGTTYSKVFGTPGSYVNDAITALGADGFTVGDGTGGAEGDKDNMNKSSTTYYYIAINIL